MEKKIYCVWNCLPIQLGQNKTKQHFPARNSRLHQQPCWMNQNFKANLRLSKGTRLFDWFIFKKISKAYSHPPYCYCKCVPERWSDVTSYPSDEFTLPDAAAYASDLAPPNVQVVQRELPTPDGSSKSALSERGKRKMRDAALWHSPTWGQRF